MDGRKGLRRLEGRMNRLTGLLGGREGDGGDGEN